MATHPTKQIYIASSLHNAERVQRLIQQFAELEVRVTYDWTQHGFLAYPECIAAAQHELAGVITARCLLLVLPARNGSHFEAGVAYANRIPIVLLCEDRTMLSTSFHHLPQLIQCDTEKSAMAAVLGVLGGVLRPYGE